MPPKAKKITKPLRIQNFAKLNEARKDLLEDAGAYIGPYPAKGQKMIKQEIKEKMNKLRRKLMKGKKGGRARSRSKSRSKSPGASRKKRSQSPKRVVGYIEAKSPNSKKVIGHIAVNGAAGAFNPLKVKSINI